MYETKSDVGDEWAIRRQGTDAGLKKKTSRSFAKPKKMKSLGRLFAGRDDEAQQLQTFVTASSMPMTMQQQYQIGFNATATVLQYPPKPLRYSPDVSPPSDDILPSSPLTLTSRLKARRSCTLKMPAIDADNVAFPHPAESSGRRTSAPTVAPRRTKSRVFSFLWSK